jgi:hypothetical protein
VSAYDIDVEVDNPTKARLALAYRNLSGQDHSLKDIVTLDELVRLFFFFFSICIRAESLFLTRFFDKIAREAGSIRGAKLRRDFLAAFADSPVDFLRSWLDSQARDLDLVLGGDRASLATSAGDDVWRNEERRKAAFYTGDWVKDSVNVHQERQQNARAVAR